MRLLPPSVIEMLPMQGDVGAGRAIMPAVVPFGAGALVRQPDLKKQVGGANAALWANAEQAGMALHIAQQAAAVAPARFPMSPPCSRWRATGIS